MTEDVDLKRLRASLRLVVHKLGQVQGIGGAFVLTPAAADRVVEYLLTALAGHAVDLAAFCRHARRQNINADDVKLLARRQPPVLEYLTRIQRLRLAGGDELTWSRAGQAARGTAPRPVGLPPAGSGFQAASRLK